MSDEVVKLKDGNIETISFYDLDEDSYMIILFGGGSRWRYNNVTLPEFKRITSVLTASQILKNIRTLNLVGVKV